MSFYFLIHLVATAFMTGLIWVIQLLHYPLFDHIEKSDFTRQMDLHRLRISFIVIPVMLAELFTGLYLLFTVFSGNFLFMINILLIGLIWLSTFLLQMPIHLKLAESHSSGRVKKLVQSNWVRTALWTIRLILLIYLSIQFSLFNSF
ncbi:hypothetical protein DYD21_18540 [Rhodohalobacter sp. SW132]|uniref:hypothetical protein n=1 Tax=Rhodohalobacter sp. SW132 TaxID=2293433 RepID=UPI000E21E85F|nr:hypothetical protein [Rhodohalobacter sp. SW132]REL24585.1 hypothetical protein DYD21_18540 [Rhodohalobacter sp. SW132]